MHGRSRKAAHTDRAPTPAAGSAGPERAAHRKAGATTLREGRALLAVAVAVLLAGRVEDVAARRRPRLLP
ncbi:hypothetical protein [Streptomyces sp. NPDC019224]|uniref:hypothetical protein n=1 Tax=Streptomyces sp. NPDC019224 TaxID=3154484 RepID=UPI0033E4B271